MIVARDRTRFLQELLVAEVLARRGAGPLERPDWRRRPSARAQAAAHARRPPASPAAEEPEPR